MKAYDYSAFERLVLPESAMTALEAHREAQNAFRIQYCRDYNADLDLIFTNPDGTPLKPDSIFSSVSN